MRDRTNLVFVDIESTGLDSSRDVILEIAALPVDANLQILDGGWSTVVNPVLPSRRWDDTTGEWGTYHPEWVLKQLQRTMNDVVLDMHSSNGLFAAIEAGEGMSLQLAATNFIRYAEQFVPHGETPLAGSSVHFDRRFLERHMPTVDKFFHYRIADVSSIKEFWRRWFPEAGEPPKVKAHRALDDCYESVNEARWYKERLQIAGL